MIGFREGRIMIFTKSGYSIYQRKGNIVIGIPNGYYYRKLTDEELIAILRLVMKYMEEE